MNVEELRHIAVLHALEIDALSRFAAVLEERVYSNGQVIFEEGDPGDSMYFIREGSIRIQKRARGRGAIEKTLAVLEGGDYFGEMALLEQRPRAAAAISAGRARVLRLSKAAFDQIHQSNSLAAMSMVFAMVRTSSERIRWLSTQLIAYDEVGKALGEGRDLQTMLDMILEQLANATGADWGFLVLRSEFTGRLDIRAQRNLALTAAQCEAVGNGEGFLAPLLANPQDLLAENFHEHELLIACPRLGFETASLLASPIILAEQLVGLIALGGEEKNQFDLNTVNLVRGIARQAAQAILNTRHREEDEARSRHSRPFVRA